MSLLFKRRTRQYREKTEPPVWNPCYFLGRWGGAIPGLLWGRTGLVRPPEAQGYQPDALSWIWSGSSHHCSWVVSMTSVEGEVRGQGVVQLWSEWKPYTYGSKLRGNEFLRKKGFLFGNAGDESCFSFSNYQNSIRNHCSFFHFHQTLHNYI